MSTSKTVKVPYIGFHKESFVLIVNWESNVIVNFVCRKRLEDSRKLWQFYWDMADEENWIKEKEQIVAIDDIGHDLSTGKLWCLLAFTRGFAYLIFYQ